MSRRPKPYLTNPVKLMTNFVIYADVHHVNRFRLAWFPAMLRRKIDYGDLKTLIMVVMIGMALCAASPAGADVVVFDQITAVNQPVFLKVMTKGRFFPAGGQRITLRIDSGRPFQLLSGGDGYGYYKFTPRKAGMFEVEAVSGDKRNSGILLVVTPPEQVLVVDAEGGLRSAALSERSESESLDALEQLNERFRIVYLTRWVGAQTLKQWLTEKKYPQSVVMKWKGSDFFERMQQRHISIAAVVGSNSLLEASREYVKRRYSFDETSHGTSVKDWSEITTLLDAGNPNGGME